MQPRASCSIEACNACDVETQLGSLHGASVRPRSIPARMCIVFALPTGCWPTALLKSITRNLLVKYWPVLWGVSSPVRLFARPPDWQETYEKYGNYPNHKKTTKVPKTPSTVRPLPRAEAATQCLTIVSGFCPTPKPNASHSLLHDNASGPEMWFSVRISAGFESGKL